MRDTGADVQYRFSYQAACVALYALSCLLEEPHCCVAVYCEVLEDFLIKGADGLYTAVQVKTRDRDQEPFKTSDQEILSCLRRFGCYEQQREKIFHRYIIATNAGFWHAKPVWQNLRYVCATAMGSQGVLTPELTPLIKSISSAEVGAKRDAMDIAVLGMVCFKLALHNRLPDFGAERGALRDALVKHIDTQILSEIDSVVDDLIRYVQERSDRSREDWVGIRHVMAPDPESAGRAMRVASRTITAESLRARLSQATGVARIVGAVQAGVSTLPAADQQFIGHAFRYQEMEHDQRASTDAVLMTAATSATSRGRTENGQRHENQDFLSPALGAGPYRDAQDQMTHGGVGKSTSPNIPDQMPQDNQDEH